jgi:hypothetical protein
MDVVSSTTAPASKRKDPPVEVLATSENSPASKFVRGSDEQTLLSSASSARTSNSSIPDSKSDVSALFNYGSQPVEHMRAAQRCLDVVSGDNLARQTLRDIELWIRESSGADAEQHLPRGIAVGPYALFVGFTGASMTEVRYRGVFDSEAALGAAFMDISDLGVLLSGKL